MKTIEVTQCHIDSGEPRSCQGCPVALALKSATLHGWAVGVRSAMTGCHHRLLPHKTIEFIRAFDRGEDVKPFSFEFKWGTP